MAQPATIAGIPSAPARRRVGSHPTAQSPKTIAAARATKVAYRLPTPFVVLGLGFANRCERFPHEVVESAYNPDEDANENAPGVRAEMPVDPVADERQSTGGAGEFEADTGVPNPSWEAISQGIPPLLATARV
jgi:hypothetical protein